jgi:hypothetical protein
VTRFFRVLGHPDEVTGISLGDWDSLLVRARDAGLLGILHARLEERELLPRVPDQVRPHLAAAAAMAATCERMARWEVNRIRRALVGRDIPLVLLKGAAYVMASLPVARGRLFSDVDVLVRRDALVHVEAALRQHGWEAIKLDPYDQRYYRDWMHELPPLRHRRRETVVDVHHAILPPSGRLRPDTEALLHAAVSLDGSGVKVLAPVDMVLHSMVHLFQDGEIRGRLRDLVDVDALLRWFGTELGFWARLASRATDFGLARPLFYALRYADRILGTPIPPEARALAAGGRPPRAVLATMDALVPRAMVPLPGGDRSAPVRLAGWCLFVRSHWLRMPPALLARHLLHQALARRRAS